VRVEGAAGERSSAVFAAVNMDAGDIIAVSEGVLLSGTWTWVFRTKRNWVGWREKSALAGLLCASGAVVLDLILTVVMHFRGDSNLAAIIFLAAFLAGILLGTAGIVLGILSKGTPKIAALIWSSVVLATTGATIFGMIVGMTQ
jgi:uncharacterized YccA/Bax inhibitor family protein